MVRGSVRALALRKVWVHSVVTATIAEEAARLVRLDSEVAYTTGLLHNLGTLGLMSAYPDEYSRMLEVSNDFGFDLLQTSAICSKSTTARPAPVSRTRHSPTSSPLPS